jgi:UDP-galactopyranose mutase
MSVKPDLLCFSHLRWNFVFQRPNHLLCRAARERRCFFVEEPMFDAEREASMIVRQECESLFVCVPHLPAAATGGAAASVQRALIERLVRDYGVVPEVLWFYTPMALAFARHLVAPAIVYDCMDELSGFAGAPPELRGLERELLSAADLVFTGGHSLFRAKQLVHPRVHAFPSSVDAAHFAAARAAIAEPADQAHVPAPRLGYFGVIDERLDLKLIADVADARPDWQLVMIGPVVKIQASTLPQRPNIHWLGRKEYTALPSYIAGWDVALMPFALNEATEFISPTKTLEYLAAGRAVVSTAIADVVHPYGAAGVVRIADHGSFIAAVEAALAEEPASAIASGDRWLARTSWDKTWDEMNAFLKQVLVTKRAAQKGRL